MWLVASDLRLQSDGAYSGALYRFTGPPHNRQPWTAATPSQVGSMSVRFNSAGSGTLTYSYGTVQVTKTIQPFGYASPATNCTFTKASRATATNYQDLWWNASESGWGLGLSHQGNILFAALFTYTDAGRDGWFLASNLSRQADGSYTGDVFIANGPPYNASPWSPVTVSPALGKMTLRFSNGETGTLAYNVGTINVTKNISRYVFASTMPVCY
jgi:hypothetical protein